MVDNSKFTFSQIIVMLTKKVGALPPSYIDFLRDGGERATAHYTNEDGTKQHIFFYSLIDVFENLTTAVVDYKERMLVIGNWGGRNYVLQLDTSSLSYWDQEVNEWGDTFGSLEPVDETFTEFLNRLRFKDKKVILQDLTIEHLVDNVDLSAAQDFIDQKGVDFTSENSTLAERSAQQGKLELLMLCVENRCNMERVLSFAIRGGHLPIVRYLIEDLAISPKEAHRWLRFANKEIKNYFGQP